jgi:hypothetical protein
MSSDHEAEIRASVAARADLGPGYDDAVAEGLVERIGAEIDKRIDARLGTPGSAGAPGAGGVAAPAGPGGGPVSAGLPGSGAPGYQPGYQGYQAPAGYQGYQGYMGPMLPPGYQMGPPPVRPSPAGQRHVATTVTALGSMALGVAATAIVSHDNHSGGQAFMVLLIWIAITVVNVAYARRP